MIVIWISEISFIHPTENKLRNAHNKCAEFCSYISTSWHVALLLTRVKFNPGMDK